MRSKFSPKQEALEGDSKKLGQMSVDGPLRDDNESREKNRKTPRVTCAKRTKLKIYKLASIN